MSKVNARLLKGFRDYLPEVELPRQHMLDTIKSVFESFGYGPLMTPALEYSEVLLGKYGAEGEKLLYRFEDNGGRDVALRYDLTVPLARVIGQHGGSLPMPFRRYQIAPVWRAEKPARGRFREFMQCDVDIVGEASVRADAECMLVGLEVLDALSVDGYVMRINNRKILDGLLDAVGVDGREACHAVMRAVDKLPKIGRDKVADEIRDAVGLSSDALDTMFGVLTQKIGTKEDLDGVAAIVGKSDVGAEGIAELGELLALVAESSHADRVEVDLSIARGLDYYTGTIYETFLVGHEEYGSVMSGGRYDTLLSTFSRQPICAVGISLGVDRLLAALLDLGIIAGRRAAADAYIALLDAGDHPANIRLAAALRRVGVKTELALKPARLGKQFKLAERKGYKLVILYGESEQASGSIVIKDLHSGTQVTRELDALQSWSGELAAPND